MSEISTRRDHSTPSAGSAADLDLTSEGAAALKQSQADTGADGVHHPRRIAQAVLSIVSELSDEGRKKIESEHALFHSPLTHGENEQPQLPAPHKPLDAATLIATLANLMASQQQETASMVSGQIKTSNLTAAATGRENIAKIEASIAKMAEAHKDGGWMDIFGWVASIATVVIAAVAVAFTGGAAAPLLAAAVLGLAMKVAQETGLLDTITNGLADLLETMGCPPEYSHVIAKALITVVVIAAQIAIVVGSGGAGAVGSAGTALQAAKVATGVVTAAGGITEAAVNMVSAGNEKDAKNLMADAKQIQGALAKIAAMMEQQQDDLKAIMKNIQVYYGFAADALRNQSSSQHAILSNMSANA